MQAFAATPANLIGEQRQALAGLLVSILRRAGMTPEELRALL